MCQYYLNIIIPNFAENTIYSIGIVKNILIQGLWPDQIISGVLQQHTGRSSQRYDRKWYVPGRVPRFVPYMVG